MSVINLFVIIASLCFLSVCVQTAPKVEALLEGRLFALDLETKDVCICINPSSTTPLFQSLLCQYARFLLITRIRNHQLLLHPRLCWFALLIFPQNLLHEMHERQVARVRRSLFGAHCPPPVGPMADPLWPHSCEVVDSVSRRMAGAYLDRKAVGLDLLFLYSFKAILSFCFCFY